MRRDRDRPDEDPRGPGFGDRYLSRQTTMDGAGRVRGDLTPECAAAVTAVLEALGKRRDPQSVLPVLGVSALVLSELLGLLADDGKNAVIAGRFRDGGQDAVECLGYD